MVAPKCVFCYLNSTKDWGPHTDGELGEGLREEGEGALRCYVNSDYAGCPGDYSSTSGAVLTFGGVVDWRSRRQKSTA